MKSFFASATVKSMEKRKFTTNLRADLIKRAKILAIHLDVSVNDLIEEGLKYVLKRYKKARSGTDPDD